MFMRCAPDVKRDLYICTKEAHRYVHKRNYILVLKRPTETCIFNVYEVRARRQKRPVYMHKRGPSICTQKKLYVSTKETYGDLYTQCL